MRYRSTLLVIATVLFVIGVAEAQEVKDSAQELDNLRLQLIDVQNRESELKARLQQLDIDLQPQNIERYFSGVGSVHPEELREQRRKQLQSEKDRTTALLEQTSLQRSRLESAIADAQAKAYQQSALGQNVLQRDEGRRLSNSARIAFGATILVLVLAAIVLTLILQRRRTSV
ncbi:MAG: hypothetical protein C5B55_06060 [Blastocatellia bacterium]|nr:MAG: hypothetical protein C5B55_06060 [Blastocatellia bacterium]